jgi:serine/threonine protein kinase
MMKLLGYFSLYVNDFFKTIVLDCFKQDGSRLTDEVSLAVSHVLTQEAFTTTNLPDPLLSPFGSITEKLFDGAEAAIYVARNETDHSSYAIKQLDHEMVEPSQLGESLHIALSIDHAHVVKTLAVFKDDNSSYQVLELCQSTLLDKICQPHSLPFDQTACIFRQMLDATSFLHSQGIAHHDLKLTNVMECENDRIKLIDFGNAYYFRNFIDGSESLRYGKQ